VQNCERLYLRKGLTDFDQIKCIILRLSDQVFTSWGSSQGQMFECVLVLGGASVLMHMY